MEIRLYQRLISHDEWVYFHIPYKSDTSEAPEYSHTSKYHPHYVLILKHFPFENLMTLQKEKTYDKYLDRTTQLDANDSPPPRFPWPLPPPRPTDELAPSVEKWMTEALRTIHKRIAIYTTSASSKPTTLEEDNKNSSETVSATAKATATAHRALLVPELLENLL
jgi:hypothetical protein